MCTDHYVILLYSNIAGLQEMTWIAEEETGGATDIILLFYEPAEYHKFAFNSRFIYRCVCASVFFPQ
jgi:hypothetical protein